MKNPYHNLREMVANMEEDFVKFYEKSNSAAGTRVRKSMKELKDEAQKIRLDVQKIKNSATAKKKAPAKKPAAKK